LRNSCNNWWQWSVKIRRFPKMVWLFYLYKLWYYRRY